jgi:ribosomal protein S18 acetylase RimI-like enzyme
VSDTGLLATRARIIRDPRVDVVERRAYCSAMGHWVVRAVRRDEFEPWARLYRGYAAFYNWPTSDEHQRQIWGWIHDDGLVEALVAAPVDDDGNERGEIQGLAHLREWVRPLRGVKCGYLDDLFVDPDHRGSGAVDALYDAMRAIAAERGWPVIRWTTGDDNYRARAVYDKLATRTTWITYDMATDSAAK